MPHLNRRLRPALSAGFLLIAFAVSACGGSESSTQPPTGNPPVTTPDITPATLTLVTGDAQTTTPGSTVAVKPVVVVKNAAGVGLANIAVTFSVDSGSGTLQTVNATTGSDGSASPGDWRLGTSEGRNVITARTGSLSALKIVATALAPTVTVPAQSVPTAGGTITLTQAGSPLQGTTLTILPGALSAANNIGFTISTATALSLPAGMTAAAPVLTITGLTSTLNQPARLRLPIAAPAGKVLVVVTQDPSTGALSVMPSSSKTATGVTVTLGTIESAAVSGLRGATLLAPQQPIIIPILIDPTLLARDFDSNFRPAVDDWDFRRQQISRFPNNSRGWMDPAASMVATSLWYYVNRKLLSGKLYQKYQEAAGIPESNWRGMRWVSVADTGLPQLYGETSVAQVERQGHAANAGPESQIEMDEIKAAFLLSSNKPQPIFTFTAANMAVDSEPRYGIAYRTVGNAVDLAIPDAPGQTFRITLETSGWKPVTVTTANGRTYAIDFISPIQYGIFVQDAKLSAQFSTVTNGTVGNAEGWPAKNTLNSKYGALDTAKIYLLDTLQHWWECPTCVDRGYRSLAIKPAPEHQLHYRGSTRKHDGTWPALGGMTASLLVDVNDLDGDPTLTTGSALYQVVGATPGSSRETFWLDWNTATYVKQPTDIKPDSVLMFDDTTVPFTVTAPGAPSGVSYRWRYKGKIIDSTDTSAPAFSRRMTEPGRRMMYADVIVGTGNNKRAIGRDSSIINYANGWLLQTVAISSIALPAAGIGSEKVDTVIFNALAKWTNDLVQIPDKHAMYHYRDPSGCRGITLGGFPTSAVPDTAFTDLESFRAILAYNCTGDISFTGTYVLGKPGEGTVVGTASDTGLDPDVITVPGGSINATMTGNKLQGSFVWKVRYSTGVALYTYNFQAKALIPK